MDVLHVSAFKPHEITQTFVDNGQTFQHLAPWRDNNSRLYRALEYFTVGDRGYWTWIGPGSPPVDSHVPSTGGRVPGKININTTSPRTLLSYVCAWAVPDTPLCNDQTGEMPAGFLTTMAMAQGMFAGIPIFRSPKRVIESDA